jgi:hypothetical protein
MTTLSRRQFLQRSLLGLTAFALRDFPISAAERVPVTVPPGLMLHSRHHKQLPELLDLLSRRGYSGINYHDLRRAASDETQLPAKPIIVSIDDISMVKGNPGFKIFRRMKDTLVSSGFRGSFAVITRPNQPQDDELWEEVASWSAQGISLETHTSYHSNLDNPNFTERDFYAEIVDSTEMIRDLTGKTVSALITPFGSGYDAAQHRVNPQVMKAAAEAKLPFIVGIVGGRGSLPHLHRTTPITYMGRATMGIDDTNTSGLYEVEHWI